MGTETLNGWDNDSRRTHYTRRPLTVVVKRLKRPVELGCRGDETCSDMSTYSVFTGRTPVSQAHVVWHYCLRCAAQRFGPFSMNSGNWLRALKCPRTCWPRLRRVAASTAKFTAG